MLGPQRHGGRTFLSDPDGTGISVHRAFASHQMPMKTSSSSGSVTARLLYRLRFTPQILEFLAERLYEKWFWLALLAGILIAPAAARMRERFVLLVTAIQLVFYIGSYFVTPHDIRWHVATSWSRLTDQIAVPLTYAVFIMLAEFLRRGEDARGAEARSEQR